MRKLLELLFHPFVAISLVWILISISSPFGAYNENNISWQIFGLLLILITFSLAIIIFRNNPKQQ